MKLKPTSLTIGVFDGVHLGHQAVLRRLVCSARLARAVPVALTFSGHPRHVVKTGNKVAFILPRKTTYERLKTQGVEAVHLMPFHRSFLRKTAEQFIQWLVRRYHLKGIVVGCDFRFGRGAAGDLRFLKKQGKRFGFQVTGVPKVKKNGAIVSSSRIRKLLERGRVEPVAKLLGCPYPITGRVVAGRQVGRKIGIPTANLSGIVQMLPKNGIYAGAVVLKGRVHHAAVNVGIRPTFFKHPAHPKVEVHVLGYQGRLYGKTLTVYLLRYLRPEIKFPSREALARQIQKDIQSVGREPLPSKAVLNPRKKA